ncbi:MAG TPA: BlaI/MecI/CopY family transcriptional regulator [Polyangiaceae bacterium]|nr:BlaI/MecI/CopY family transcriptional regulator [Polyangiaceae bacterium]
MAKPPLTRREREIMDIVYKHGRATAQEVLAELAEPPSYSAVRALMRLLEERGHLKHKSEGTRYVYFPAVPRGEARRRALSHLVSTFFDGSVEQTMLALVENSRARLAPEELDRLAEIVERARKEGR